MYDCQIYASRNLVFTGVNLVSSGVNRVSSSGNKKVRMPPIEQHPLQIRQRPVQKAQSQQKNCLLLHHSALIAGASARQPKKSTRNRVPTIRGRSTNSRLKC